MGEGPAATAEVDWETLRDEARARFAIARFRPGQREIIQAVVRGEDVVGILPTGAGKSLCYQLPALFLPRATVVVSPLISLMQDQQEKLAEVEIPAAKLDSTLSSAEERQVVREIRRGEHELVYVTPERLENPDYLEILRRTGVSLLVVDEAHCVSQWGHDFRPAYLALREAARALGRPPVLALTATATPEVLADVCKQLDLRRPRVVSTGIDRPNLRFEVFRTVNEEMKRARLREMLASLRAGAGCGAGAGAGAGAGIVYTATVRLCDDLWRWLGAEGVRAGRYHAKRPNAEREETQQRFMAGEHEAIVATKAFGMGIDKPDIRFVVHWNFPDSLESYYQEAGRAGRDGRPARAALFYRLEDKRIQSYFLGGKYPRRDQSRALYETLSRLAAEPGGERGATLKELIAASELPERRVKVIVALLESAGLVARGRRLRKLRDFATAEEVEAFLAAYEQRHTGDRERLAAMMRYAEATGCRVQALRAYFCEDDGERCGTCDNCRRTADSGAAVAAAHGG